MSNWALLQEQLAGKPVYKRAKHGIHFQNSDGSITANFSGKPCHYEDGGIWKPIDTKLIALGDGFYGCPHSKVKVHPNGTVAVTGTDYAQRVELPSAQTGLLDGDKMVRKFSFGEQRMWVTEDGFRSEIQLNRIPTLAEARKLIASESGTLSKEYLKSLTTATDANGDTHTYSPLSAFRIWLASAKFPVVIDPDFAGGTADKFIYGLNADYATARSTSSDVDTTSNFLRIGQVLSGAGGSYGCYRGFMVFDTSSIDDGETITQVNLKAVAINDTSTNNFDIQIVKQNWTGTRETDYDGCLAGDADDAIWRNTSGMSLNTQYTSGNLSTAWVNKTGSTYYSFRSSRDFAGTSPGTGGFIGEYMYLASQNHATEGYRPLLSVTYSAGGSIIPIVNYYNRLRRN